MIQLGDSIVSCMVVHTTNKMGSSLDVCIC
jgi:hypothetical protein